MLVGAASRSPGVMSRQPPPVASMTNRWRRLSPTYSSQWRKKRRLKTRAFTGSSAIAFSRSAFKRSLSAKGSVLYSGWTADTKTIRLPSGLQAAFSAPVAMFVRRTGAPPAAGTTWSCEEPVRLDWKRIVDPSGDHLGRESLVFPSATVSARGGAEPSAGAIHNAVALPLASGLTVVTCQTTCFPSGEICGSATRRKRNRSSISMRRFAANSAAVEEAPVARNNDPITITMIRREERPGRMADSRGGRWKQTASSRTKPLPGPLPGPLSWSRITHLAVGPESFDPPPGPVAAGDFSAFPQVTAH